MDTWEKVFREGFAPLLSDQSLATLRQALVEDDPALIQGSTTRPPPIPAVEGWAVEAACVLGYCGWKGEELKTVGEVEEYFARACFEADQRLGEPAACRWFVNWFDDTPRQDARQMLLAVVDDILWNRLPTTASAPDVSWDEIN